jgi:hypothetical protein
MKVHDLTMMENSTPIYESRSTYAPTLDSRLNSKGIGF